MKKIVLYPCNEIMFNHKKEQSADIWYNMDEPWKHYTEWKKPKGHISKILFILFYFLLFLIHLLLFHPTIPLILTITSWGRCLHLHFVSKKFPEMLIAWPRPHSQRVTMAAFELGVIWPLNLLLTTLLKFTSKSACSKFSSC